MRSKFVIIFFLLTTGTLNSGHAFMRSQEEMNRIEIRAAKARANDFLAYKQRTQMRIQKRLQHVAEYKAKVQKKISEEDFTRRRFIEKRNLNGKMELLNSEAKEHQEELRLEKKEKIMNQQRLEYVKKRNEMEEIIRREAVINPADEYGLYPFQVESKPVKSGR